MIKIINGNILNASEDIICHQVNCQGVMGSGLAKQIKDKYPEVYKDYINFCKKYSPPTINILGQVCISQCNDGKYVAHLFGQDKYGRDKKYTDYTALESALIKLVWDNVQFENSNIKNKSIAIPFNLGCGLAGGNWDIVYKIIEEVFEDYDVTIYKFK